MQASCNWPFSEKHARQQASIIGNMQAAGLLQGAQHSVYLELGAGKGYLGGLLAEVARPKHLVLMDYRSTYKAKVGGVTLCRESDNWQQQRFGAPVAVDAPVLRRSGCML